MDLHPWNAGFSWTDRVGPFTTLTAEQVSQFDEQGYVVVPDLVDPATLAAVRDEIDGYEAEVDGLLQQAGGRVAIAESGAITFATHLVTRSERLRQLARHPRIVGICGDLVGPDVHLYWDQAVYKKPEKPRRFPWHQDNGYAFVEPQQYLTVWLALTDATVDNGCPWVVPGLHRHGTLAHRYVEPLGFECLSDPAGAVAAEVPAGGAVVFSSLTPHLTGPNTTDAVRKAYILQYAPAGAEILQGDPAAGPPTMRTRADDHHRQFAVLREARPVTPRTATDLTLDERCLLLGGASTWRTSAIERIGLPAVKMSDGPNGVRGEAVGATRTPGVTVPVGIALGATWDPGLLREVGSLLGTEAVRKGAHVLLAPTVNLQRTPVGGRVFECYAEDPELTARLAVAFVRGVQSHDVAVTVKHFVANDTEVDRFSVDAQVPERALRELYLRPFEAAVREAGAWGVMSAYNRLAGEFCAANRRLLHDILREEWGFDGFVVSDWFGSHDTVPSALAGLDVAMPGPTTIYGPPLAEAVARGDVPEATVDALVDDVLRLIERTRADERSADRPEETVDDPDERALCRRAATAGLVLLRNERSALPLAPDARVAVIGPNASATRIMGGGSSSLEPLPHASILAALADRLTAPPTFDQGVRIDKLLPPLDGDFLRTPDGRPGLLVEYRDGTSFDGPVAAADVSSTSMLRLFGSVPAGVDATAFTITASGSFVPDADGPHLISAVVTGAGRVTVGDVVVLDDPDRSLPRSSLFFGNASAEQTAEVDCTAGVPVPVTIASTGRSGFCGVRLGVRPVDPPDLLERAVAAAASADVAVVVVGTNDEWETEGEDRSTIQLPGDQDELVARVAAANPRTVVVVNAGSPVSMPWVDDVAAVLVAYFGGQEMGPAVADVLVGASDPGGRLPITYPRRLEDTPAWPHYAPVEGAQVYGEGLLMGYRGFDAGGTAPLFPFGHGLSYGACSWGEATLDLATEGGVTVSLDLTADGDRATTAVVQAYVAPVDPPVERAPKELAAWTKVVVAPGSTERVAIQVPATAFRRWDEDANGWTVDEGRYEILVAASAGDVRQRLPFDVGHNL